jgi:arylsulfatase A-like enzyme
MQRTLMTSLLLAVAVAASAADQPNFVLIFIDDMGYGDIGPYGSTVNSTPNLDRLSDEGMKLTSFYAAPVCSASRAQLLTGCYAPRVSVPGVFFPAGSRGLNPAEWTVAEYLKELGYATTCIGKWHLGDQPEFLPTNQGFDHYFGIPYSNDMQRASAVDGRRVTPLLRDDKVAELLEDEGQRRVTREYTEEAVKFIEQNRERPFFLYLPHTAMHVPLFPHQDFVGTSDNGTYGDWVAEVDWSVGQVIAALRKHQLEKKTLVIFTSDNGPWASKGKAGGVSGPLRGSKGCTLEGGVREPTICWWPGRIDAGSDCDAVAGTTDILPTFVRLAGGKVRDDVKIDGQDISPLLFGDTTESPHEAWYYYQGTRLQAIRSGPWKLAISSQSLGMGIREKPADLQQPGVRLYNLDEEIGEVTNIAEKHPDVVARLQLLADQMIGDIGSGQPGTGVRPPGVNNNPVTLYPTKQKNGPQASTASRQPIDWNQLKIGAAFASNSAPQIAGQPFQIHAKVEPTTDGIILAHGGSAVGYALYVKNGEVVFAVRHAAGDIDRIHSAKLNNRVETQIVAGLDAKGGINLTVGKLTIEGKTSGPISKQPQEDFCVGHDNQNPLDEQAPRKPFGGKILELRVTVGK